MDVFPVPIGTRPSGSMSMSKPTHTRTQWLIQALRRQYCSRAEPRVQLRPHKSSNSWFLLVTELGQNMVAQLLFSFTLSLLKAVKAKRDMFKS